jgi:hypothetical protein
MDKRFKGHTGVATVHQYMSPTAMLLAILKISCKLHEDRHIVLLSGALQFQDLRQERTTSHACSVTALLRLRWRSSAW